MSGRCSWVESGERQILDVLGRHLYWNHPIAEEEELAAYIREVEQEWEQELAEQWLDGEARDFYFNLDRKVKDVEASAKTFHHNGRSQHHTEYKDKLNDFSGKKVIVSNNHFVYHKGGT